MGPLPNGRTPWLIHGGVPNNFQVLGWSFKLRMDMGWLRCGRRDWQTGCNFCWKSFQVTWKTAVATLISINLKPQKPAIQLPKKKSTFLCFPGRKQCYGGCVHESLSVCASIRKIIREIWNPLDEHGFTAGRNRPNIMRLRFHDFPEKPSWCYCTHLRPAVVRSPLHHPKTLRQWFLVG